MRDLPVALSLAPELRDEVAGYVEGECGWQVVGLDGPPPPALVLADAALPGRPCVVLVPAPANPGIVRAALQAGALDVLAWPTERARLREAPEWLDVGTVLAGPPVVRVGGARGGVGTSTVALALAGLAAWAGRRALVVGRDDLCELCGLGVWEGPDALDIAGLGPHEAGPEVAAHQRAVAAVPRLAVLGGGPEVPPVGGWPVDLVVVDVGAHLDPVPDLVCARPGVGLARAGATGAPVALVGEGPLPAAAVRRVLGRPPAGQLPASVRVARAGATGRVPAGLPGSWLAAVRGLARAIVPAGGLSTGSGRDLATGSPTPRTVVRRPRGGEAT